MESNGKTDRDNRLQEAVARICERGFSSARTANNKNNDECAPSSDRRRRRMEVDECDDVITENTEIQKIIETEGLSLKFECLKFYKNAKPLNWCT